MNALLYEIILKFKAKKFLSMVVTKGINPNGKFDFLQHVFTKDFIITYKISDFNVKMTVGISFYFYSVNGRISFHFIIL